MSMAGALIAGKTETASREPVDVLDLRIRAQLWDMCCARVPHLQQLVERLQIEAFQWNHAPLARALAALQSAVRTIHFLPLRQGWLARLFGRDRAPPAQFIAAYERVLTCASQVKTELAQLTSGFEAPGASAQPALAELEGHWQALNGGIDDGVTCLQDLCTQLAEAREQGCDDGELATQAEAAQFFTQDFKRLQSLSSLARDAAVRARSVMVRRAALLEQTGADVAMIEQGWARRVKSIVAELEAGRRPGATIPSAIEAHDNLLKRLAASADACSALQHEEHLLARKLGLLEGDIQLSELRTGR